MPRKYNGGIASYAIWLPEFTQFIDLYQSGKNIDEIKKLSDEENIFQMSSKARSKRCSRNLAVRIKALPDEIIELFPHLNITNQKIVALLSVMLTSRLLDEFLYDVYRPKILMQDTNLQDYEVASFFNQKRIESPEIAKWSLKTTKRLEGALKTFLRDAGLMKDTENNKENKLLFPLLDSQLALVMKKNRLNYELAALGEI